MSLRNIPNSCDTMVALGSATRNHETIFAKNSDRPAEECQPLVQQIRASYQDSRSTGCQYVPVPQSNSTLAHIGSRPYWCWGYEHGFNENQVVIGNEALHSKLPIATKPRLIGMELVRLGLERGHDAEQAVEVITSMVSKYGQGKFEAPDLRSYDNGFIVADPNEAYIIETAGHEWAVKRVESTIGISNIYSLGSDWDQVSPDAKSNAVAKGWSDASGSQLNFSEAYSEHTASKPGRSSERRARSCTLLEQNIDGIHAKTMMDILRDHSDGSSPGEEIRSHISSTRSICTHYSNSVDGNTAASLVADLCADGSRTPIYWCSFYAPCLSVFLPIFLEGKIPTELSIGNKNPSTDSPWWVFRNLEHKIRKGNEIDMPVVEQIRSKWVDLQDELLGTAYELAAAAGVLIQEGKETELSYMLTEYMRKNFDRAMEIARHI